MTGIAPSILPISNQNLQLINAVAGRKCGEGSANPRRTSAVSAGGGRVHRGLPAGGGVWVLEVALLAVPRLDGAQLRHDFAELRPAMCV